MRYVIFLGCFICFSGPSHAVDINYYTVSATGVFHDVMVAFDDLDKTGKVRCVIEKNGKPVGMSTAGISGVGTLQIMISGGVKGNTAASCKEVR